MEFHEVARQAGVLELPFDLQVRLRHFADYSVTAYDFSLRSKRRLVGAIGLVSRFAKSLRDSLWSPISASLRRTNWFEPNPKIPSTVPQ